MTDHIHLFRPGASITCVAGEDLIGGRLVEVVDTRTVAHSGADSGSVFGVAAQDTPEGGDVLVLRGGVQELLVSGPVAAGDRIVSATGGKVSAAGADEVGIGLALSAATVADELVQIALDR